MHTKTISAALLWKSFKSEMELSKESAKRIQRDNQLVDEALKNGDQRAYTALMESHKDSLYYMIFKMVNNPYEAEDLTIEAFGKAFRNLSDFSKNYAFSTWLYTIAANNCIDFLRRKSTSPLCVDDDLETCEQKAVNWTNAIERKTPEDFCMEKQRIAMMRMAVGQMRENYRKLIELRYFNELSYEEIAQELNISLANVKIKLFRAKDMLANIMRNMKHNI